MTPHPHFAAIIAAYAAARRPPFHAGTAEDARALLRASMMAAPPPAGLPALGSVTDATIDGPNGAIPVRHYLPRATPAGCCVYFHAGGWVLGDLSSGDALCRRLADASGCEIINVDYRLAPEHPYPVPLDDAYAAVTWAGRRPGALILAGESAGGNLAAACAIRARDAGGPAIAGQFLAYPVVDPSMATASYRENAEGLLLSAADMRWFWDQYCPPAIDRTDALAAPLAVRDAAGLPPALVFVAGLDPLRDEGLAYADRLTAAGVAVTVRQDLAMVHGYLNAAGAVPEVADAVRQAGAWIAACCESSLGRNLQTATAIARGCA